MNATNHITNLRMALDGFVVATASTPIKESAEMIREVVCAGDSRNVAEILFMVEDDVKGLAEAVARESVAVTVSYNAVRAAIVGLNKALNPGW